MLSTVTIPPACRDNPLFNYSADMQNTIQYIQKS
jgi:hypothetical protein